MRLDISLAPTEEGLLSRSLALRESQRSAYFQEGDIARQSGSTIQALQEIAVGERYYTNETPDNRLPYSRLTLPDAVATRRGDDGEDPFTQGSGARAFIIYCDESHTVYTGNPQLLESEWNTFRRRFPRGPTGDNGVFYADPGAGGYSISLPSRFDGLVRILGRNNGANWITVFGATNFSRYYLFLDNSGSTTQNDWGASVATMTSWCRERGRWLFTTSLGGEQWALPMSELNAQSGSPYTLVVRGLQ